METIQESVVNSPSIAEEVKQEEKDEQESEELDIPAFIRKKMN